MKRKKILIVGGTGFIGFHLAKKCLKSNMVVTSLSTKKPIKKRKLDAVKYINLDISKKRNFKILKNAKFNYVVNAGGYVDHKNKTKTFNSHYVGLKNLVNFFKRRNIERFIQIGSSAEYGKTKSPQLEKSKCNPKMIYGKSKHLGSKFLLDCYNRFDFPAVILRLYQVYGPHQDINRLIPIVIDKSLKNEKYPCSTGKQFRDFLFISDCIEAIYKSLKKPNLSGEIINIGQGKPKQVYSVIQKIKKSIGGGIPLYGKIKLRKDESKIIYPNISKAKKKLSWHPLVNFEKGLNKTIFYFEKNFVK